MKAYCVGYYWLSTDAWEPAISRAVSDQVAAATDSGYPPARNVEKYTTTIVNYLNSLRRLRG